MNKIFRPITTTVIVLDMVGSCMCVVQNDYISAIYFLLLAIMLLIVTTIKAIVLKGDK